MYIGHVIKGHTFLNYIKYFAIWDTCKLKTYWSMCKIMKRKYVIETNSNVSNKYCVGYMS
jgi:TM2 domain-containing membrane protein YozV